MQTYHLPDRTLEILHSPSNRIIFEALGFDNARFVGGCVRDALFGLPRDDIDIATPHPPDDVLKILTQHSVKVIPTGLKHGTVTAVIDNHPVEITTLRQDVSCDGRHADVVFTQDWALDALRRDFTINSLSADWDGKIYDYTKGYEDLFTHTIRFVGNAKDRCMEDYLRILRYFRFYARYGTLSNVDNEAIEACELLAPQLKKLSAERIHTEMLKIIAAPSPMGSLHLMQQHHVLEQILPFSIELSSLERLISFPYPEASHPVLRLACLLSTIPNHEAETLVQYLSQHWKISNQERQILHTYLCQTNQRDALIFSDDQSAKKLIRKLGKHDYIGLLLLHHCSHDSIHDLHRLYTMAQEWAIPEFPVRGSDLMALGFHGRQIGVGLKHAESWWEEHHFLPTKQEILTWSQKHFP
ncbi:MAG: CCA tRNA nucleotidyltransferase [Alphaproteobacteria bacterium]|nr:CCA tRNA nucleotidyltransferase [Alphaproteobacteria bacterium]